MTSVCILSAAWGRFDVTRLALAQRQRLCEELASRGLRTHSLIVADDENLDIAAEYGCETIEAPNRPLGRKCNIGLRAAAGQADYVVWIGSDDWLHPDLFNPLLEPRESPLAAVHSGRSVAVVNLPTGTMQIISVPSERGCVPWIIDSRLLQARKHEPMRPELNRGLDGALVRGMRLARVPFEIVIAEKHPFRCVDFKSELNLTPYAGITKHLAVGDENLDPWPALANYYPADLVEAARELSEKESRK